MNTFQRLCWLAREDLTSPEVDILLCELTARVAAAGHPLCLALHKKEDVPKLYALVYLFDGYGMQLTQRFRQHGDGVFVFLGAASEREAFAGVVRERRL